MVNSIRIDECKFCFLSLVVGLPGAITVGEGVHTFFISIHEYKTGSEQQIRWQMLKATLFPERWFVPQDNRNLNDPCQPGSHERVSEYLVDHCGKRELLRMRRHSIASQEYD